MSFRNIPMSLRPGYTPSVQELRALVTCGDLGSVSRAADALNLTQSAVSRSIRALEDRLGVRLFHRVRKRLHLSDAGRAMVHDARDILARIDNSARMVMAFGGGGDVIRLAALPTFASTWLIPRLPEFLRQHPALSIDLASALHPVDFEDSPFDAAVQRADMARNDTEVTPILDEDLICVASPDLINPSETPSAEDLTRYPLIQLATRPELWNEWFALAGTDRLVRTSGPRFQHFDMVISAAQASMGVAILPRIFAEQAISAGLLHQVHATSLQGETPYALIRPIVRKEGKAMDSFENWLKEATASNSSLCDKSLLN